MKILELEQKIISGELITNCLNIYESALKYVPKDNRSEHCYHTAIAIGVQNRVLALELLELGIKYSNGFWLDEMRCYRYIGLIYELEKQYEKSLEYYNVALSVARSDMYNQYLKEYSYLYLRVELHKSSFKYTEELRKCCNKAVLCQRNNGAYEEKLYYTAIARMLIYEHDGRFEEAKSWYYIASSLLTLQNTRSLSHLLKHKPLSETVCASEDSKVFLNSLRQFFESYN